MKTSLQINPSILVVLSLALAGVPIHVAWATTAHWPLSTITIPFTDSKQPARTAGGRRFRSRRLGQLMINLPGGLRLAPPGSTERVGRFNNAAPV